MDRTADSVASAGREVGCSRPAARRVGWICAFSLVLISAFLRIHTALADPNFDTTRAAGMLKSDPALLYYVTERILAAGGLPPADFRADPRIEHPDTEETRKRFEREAPAVCEVRHSAGRRGQVSLLPLWRRNLFGE